MGQPASVLGTWGSKKNSGLVRRELRKLTHSSSIVALFNHCTNAQGLFKTI